MLNHRSALPSALRWDAALTDPLAKIVLLVRLLCFMAVFYLALYKIVVRLSRKPGSKLLWFFAVLTAPLTLPVKKFSNPDASNEKIVSYALIFYGLLWFLVVFADRYWLN